MSKDIISKLKNAAQNITMNDEQLSRGRERLEIHTCCRQQIKENSVWKRPAKICPWYLRPQASLAAICLMILGAGCFTYTYPTETKALWQKINPFDKYGSNAIIPLEPKNFKPGEMNIPQAVPESDANMEKVKVGSSNESKGNAAAVITSDSIETLKKTVELPESAQGKRPTTTPNEVNITESVGRSAAAKEADAAEKKPETRKEQ